MNKLEGTSIAIEFGPKNTEPVSLSHINELEQIRKTYDQEAIKDLARSMTHENSETGEISFDMYNPLLAAYLTREEAEEYVTQHAAFYGSSRSIHELIPDQHGNYVILISGHRRKRAIEFLMDGNGGGISRPSKCQCKLTTRYNIRRSINRSNTGKYLRKSLAS